MKENKTEYTIVNAFAPISETERKEKINNVIKSLCVLDIEKAAKLDYNIDIEFHGSVLDLERGGTLKC